MGKFTRSWRLMIASFKLFRKSPRLMVFPLTSGVAVLTIALLLLGGGALLLLPHDPEMNFEGWQRLAGLGLVAMVYFICAFIMIFFNAALVSCVLRQLEGESYTLRSGMRLAWNRRGAIFRWAMLYSAVGTLLGWLEERLSVLPFVGQLMSRIVIRLIGATWSLVTFLIVPVIVFEEQPSLWARVQRSTDLFKHTWGEQVIGRIGVGAILATILVTFHLLMWTAVLFAVFAVDFQGATPAVLTIATLTLTILSFIGFLLIGSAVNGIYNAVLYSYAVTGMLPQEFSPELLPRVRRA